MAKYPVCGMTVAPNFAVATDDYQGKLRYFCSGRCHDKFLADPALYIDKEAGPATVPSKSAI